MSILDYLSDRKNRTECRIIAVVLLWLPTGYCVFRWDPVETAGVLLAVMFVTGLVLAFVGFRREPK